MRGGSVSTSVSGPESQEGACESLNNKRFILIFFILCVLFQLFIDSKPT